MWLTMSKMTITILKFASENPHIQMFVTCIQKVVNDQYACHISSNDMMFLNKISDAIINSF